MLFRSLPLESKKVAIMTLSILDQTNGKHMTRTAGSALLSNYESRKPEFVTSLLQLILLLRLVHAGLWVCTDGWGWSDFLGLKKLKDPSEGYLVGSSCVVKADVTILGSSTKGKI